MQAAQITTPLRKAAVDGSGLGTQQESMSEKHVDEEEHGEYEDAEH